MKTPESQADLDQLIYDGIEESLTLDYKAAGSLAKNDSKKSEITKDVSAMANSAGGIIVYGIREDATHKHLPGSIDPINRADISKEWLEQIISGIRPKLTVRILPIALNNSSNDAAYVVEIPQGDTAHQATDLRYYRRFNFESVPMQDYEIRDVMARTKLALFEVETRIEVVAYTPPEVAYKLGTWLHNCGKVTGYDLMVIVDGAPDTSNTEFDSQLWTLKPQTQKPTLLSAHPLHPESDQALANWKLGKGEIPVNILFETNPKRVPPERLHATYDGRPVRMQVRLFARDQAPQIAPIEYSSEEIQNRLTKKIRCEQTF